MKDLKIKKLHEETLGYFTPSLHKNAKRLNDNIPGTFELQVSPSACGRSMCLRSYQNNSRHEKACLYIEESDIVSNCYEELIPEAVEKILERVCPAPQAIVINLTCIDDILGSDHEALLLILKDRFPGLRFGIRPIDPIRCDTAPKPGMTLAICRFGLLDPCNEHDNGINIVDGSLPVSKESELYFAVEKMGGFLRQAAKCRSFREFTEMEKSSLNLATNIMGYLPCRDMAERLGIPYIYCPSSYNIEKISQTYQELAELMNADLPDLEAYKAEAKDYIAETKKLLNGVPVIVGKESSRPLTLGRTLTEYGFNVVCVFEDDIIDGDPSDYEWLKEQHPEIAVRSSFSPDMFSDSSEAKNALALGYKSGYKVNAGHVMIFPKHSEDFGYQAVSNLMRSMIEAYKVPADYRKYNKEKEGI